MFVWLKKLSSAYLHDFTAVNFICSLNLQYCYSSFYRRVKVFWARIAYFKCEGGITNTVVFGKFEKTKEKYQIFKNFTHG
jgi:hypothetical protein